MKNFHTLTLNVIHHRIDVAEGILLRDAMSTDIDEQLQQCLADITIGRRDSGIQP
ncbi:hypothetical protein [Methylobacterium sp. JK268]